MGHFGLVPLSNLSREKHSTTDKIYKFKNLVKGILQTSKQHRENPSRPPAEKKTTRLGCTALVSYSETMTIIIVPRIMAIRTS